MASQPVIPSSPWKTAAVRGVAIAACASGIYAPNAMGVGYCGPTVDASMNAQCVLEPSTGTPQTINSGVTISVTTDAAVLVPGDQGYYEGAPYGSLTNNGTIVSEGSGSWDGGSFSANKGLWIWGELLGTVTNNGQIRALSSNPGSDAGAIGVLEGGAPTMQGTLNNTGLIEASATTTGTGSATALGFYITNAMASTAVINNSGTIRASAIGDANSSTQAYGIIINGYGGLNGTINNSGTISATSSSGVAMALGAVAGNGVLNNSGTLTATGPNGLGFSVYLVDNGSGAMVVNNLAGGLLQGSLYALGSGSTVNNAGTIDLRRGEMGFVGGNYTQTATGMLRIAAESNNTENGYSKLLVSGTASIAGKAYVDVATVNTLAAGQKLINVVSAGTLTGNFGSVDDNSAMFNFRSLATPGEAGHIDLEIVKALTAVQAVTENGATPALGAAAVIDSIVDQGASTPGMQSVIDTLGQMTTSQQVSNAVSQTLPLLTAGSAAATMGALGSINRIIQARHGYNRGMSSGDDFAGDKTAWFKPFGSWADQKERNAVPGYKANTYGMILGLDSAVSSDLRVGGAFAYAKSDIDGQSSVAPQSADVKVYQLIGYGSYSLDAQTDINFQASVGRNSNTGVRQISFMGTTATSDYDSQTAGLGVGIARTYPLSADTSITPSVRADYIWIKDKSYSENGAGALNLNVDSRSTEAFILGLDGKLTHQLNDQTTLLANLGVGYDTINDQAALTSVYAGQPGAAFVTYGLDQSPWLGRGGLGAVYKVKDTVEITARYDAEFRSDFLNQTASAKVRWAF